MEHTRCIRLKVEPKLTNSFRNYVILRNYTRVFPPGQYMTQTQKIYLELKISFFTAISIVTIDL